MYDKKLLVIGSTSFAASCLINASLSRDIQVLGVSRSKEYADIFLPYANAKNRRDYQSYQIDIRSDLENLLNLIDKEKPAIIVDFAGQGMVSPSWKSPEQWYDTNVVAKSRLINHLHNCDFLDSYIKISTPEVYGSSSSLIKEDTSYNPTTPYAVSHAAIDMHLRAYFKQYGFPVITTRFANFYGPHQQLYRLAPRIFLSALTGVPFNLEGGGTSIRAFIHGADVSDAILKTMEVGVLGETYHFTTDEFVTIRNFVDQSLQICGKDFSDVVTIAEDRPGKDAAYLMSGEKVNSQFYWKPDTSLQEGLESVYRWINDNLQTLKNLPINYIHKR